MTDTPKPLTADEIAEFKAWLTNDLGFYTDRPVVTGPMALRLIATIEQRDEQIERLRTALSHIRIKSLNPAIQNEAFSALAATEPKP